MAKVLENKGLVLEEKNFKVIKKVGQAGDQIPKHNHPEENILFTVVKGEVEVFIDEERFEMSPGKVLSFDGNSYIRANIVRDAEVFVTLIRK